MQTEVLTTEPAVRPARMMGGTHVLAAGSAVLLAACLRWPYFSYTTYPLNDGGMFAQILDDLRANHFLLPRETTYNFEHIPLAYPPLGFYIAGALQAVLHVSTVQIVRWEPSAFVLLSVVGVYCLGLGLLNKPYLACCAAVLYAGSLRGLQWLLMGGGITRAPAEAFVIFGLAVYVTALRERSNRLLVIAGVLVGLGAWTHPEAGLLGGSSLAVLTFTPLPSQRPYALAWRLRRLVLVGVVSLLIFVPYPLFVLHRFGPTPMVAALFTRKLNDHAAVVLFAVATVTMFLVQWWCCPGPPFLLWALVLAVVLPRSLPTHLPMPLSLFEAWVVGQLIDRAGGLRWAGRSQQLVGVGLCAVFTLGDGWNFLATHRFPTSRYDDLVSNASASLSSSEVAAMDWVRTHTAPADRFYVFDEQYSLWPDDHAAEWFPYFAQRPSVYTVQGTEWLAPGAFDAMQDRNPRQHLGDPHKPPLLPFEAMVQIKPLDPFAEMWAIDFRKQHGYTRVLYDVEGVTIYARQHSATHTAADGAVRQRG